MDELFYNLSFMRKNKYGFKYNNGEKQWILFLHSFLSFLYNCFFPNSFTDSVDLLDLIGSFLWFDYI